MVALSMLTKWLFLWEEVGIKVVFYKMIVVSFYKTDFIYYN